MSTANQIFGRVDASRARAATASTSPPAVAAAAAASDRARPITAAGACVDDLDPALRLRSASSAAAWRADSTVPEIPPEMWIETMSRPASTSGS